MKDFIKNNCGYIMLALFVLALFAIWFSKHEADEAGKLVTEVEYIDSTNTYNKIYYEKEINDLRKENKELFDSLRKCKNDIDFLVQFKYKKSYNTGVVYTKKNNENIVQEKNPEQVIENVEEKVEAKTYEYLSEPNDTFEYRLRVNADKEPNWYSLSANVSDKFTIVNKKKDDSNINHITIDSQGNGDISGVTVFKKKEKKKFKDRFAVGPGATAGYDPINKNWGVMVGIGVSYDLW